MSSRRTAVLTAAGIGALVLSVLFFTLRAPVGEAVREIEVLHGASLDEIAELLKEKRVVRSDAVFKLYAFLSGGAHRIQPGLYRFDPGTRIPSVVRRLIAGPPEVQILIPEGKSLRDIEAIFVRLGFLREGDLSNFPPASLEEEYPFLKKARTLEGFLFPDTYRILSGSSPEAIVRKFLDTFKRKAFDPIFLGDSSGRGWYDDLIIASLVEREVSDPEDRRLVASILRRRLTIGMALQVDATVAYAACRGLFDGCPPLTREDFQISSEFNTYARRGLPPAPIANPGEEAIRSVRNPLPSNFFYYLSDPKTGKTIFSETFEEHDRNRARYLKR